MKIIVLSMFLVIIFGMIQIGNADAATHVSPPLKQINDGIKPYEVVCMEGLEMVIKQSSRLPVCVSPASIEKLVGRGYAEQIIGENLRIGVLFSTEGNFSTHGYENYLAAKIAIDDFNEYLTSINKDIELIPATVNVSSDPQKTLEETRKLHVDGVNVFIGPQSSSELKMIKPYIDSSQILLISPSSTASSLAVADSIYRLVPDDTNQGNVISTLLEDDNITTAVLLVRNDVWGNELASAIKEAYLGNVLQVSYETTDIPYEDKLQELSDLVAAEPMTQETAIVVIGFGETVDFMQHASSYNILDDVKWFGTDSNANEEKITQNEQASAFAETVSFKAVQFASDQNNSKHDDLEFTLYTELGYLPSTYAFATYDAVWIAGLSMLEANSIEPGSIESKIRDVSKSYKGMLGDLDLNETGDLESENYDVWFIVDGQWYKEQ